MVECANIETKYIVVAINVYCFSRNVTENSSCTILIIYSVWAEQEICPNLLLRWSGDHDIFSFFQLVFSSSFFPCSFPVCYLSLFALASPLDLFFVHIVVYLLLQNPILPCFYVTFILFHRTCNTSLWPPLDRNVFVYLDNRKGNPWWCIWAVYLILEYSI